MSLKKSLFLLSAVICLSSPVFAEESCIHEWVELDVEEATCVEDGYKTFMCDKCYDEKEVVLKATGIHVWDDWEIEEATCGEDGYKVRFCLNCDESERIVLKATGKHIWYDWIVDEEPSCIYDGFESRFCKVCDESQERMINATGIHNWDDWEVLRYPDCMNKGKSIRYCDVCGNSQSKVLPMTPNTHSYGPWQPTNPATLFSAGSKERTCSVCLKTQKKSIPKISPAKASTKSEIQALKTVTNFFKYAKSYDTKNIKKCFTSPNKVNLAIQKKYMAKFFKSNNGKYLNYAVKSIKSTKSTVVINVDCKYYDGTNIHYNSFADLLLYAADHPKASSGQLDKVQYNSALKWFKKLKKSYTYRTVKFTLKKSGNYWKITTYTKDMDNVIHSNYTDAYNSVF